MTITKWIRISVLFFAGISVSGIAAMENKNYLTKIAKDYLEFINDVGTAKSVQADDLRIQTLFAENLTKIDNHSVLFANNRQALLAQMKGFEKENRQSEKDDWTVNKDDAVIISSSETNSVVIYFDWMHVNVGHGITAVTLKLNADNKIERITDVWAPVKD